MKIKIRLAVLLMFLGFFGCQKLVNKLNCDLDSVTTSGEFYDKPDSKIWVHRIYNHSTANKLLPIFNGLETDLVFDSNKNMFDLRHDVDGAFTNRSLDDFWGNIENVSDYYYWLDFKNLNSETADKSKDRLLCLLNKYGLENNAFVESTSPELLNDFNDAGIYNSYWGPHFDPNDTKADKKGRKQIEHNLCQFNLNAVSSHSGMIPFLTKHFNDCNLYLWTNGLFLEKDKKKIDSLVSLKAVKIILVDLDTMQLEQ